MAEAAAGGVILASIRRAPPPTLRATSPASQGRIKIAAVIDGGPHPFTGEVARRVGGGAAEAYPFARALKPGFSCNSRFSEISAFA